MKITSLTGALAMVIVAFCVRAHLYGGETRPFASGQFEGRIAWSADGNHNDPDDWAASPVALAIFAEAGVRDRLVHFDYNSILPKTHPEWERIHAESVLGAAERYGYEPARFYDCRKNLADALASLTRVINDSSADNPLYLIIAGPMEVPYRAMTNAEPQRRKFVFCISHSRWNDGFASGYQFTFNKRSVIEQGIHWVQIADQNARLSFGQYGRPASPEEFKPYFWMRDSTQPKLQFLWERMRVSTRPDPSDAGMAYFLVTGSEACDPDGLKSLLEEHSIPPPLVARRQVRMEAENFRHLDGFILDDKKDKGASHQLAVRLSGTAGSIRTHFDEPFAASSGRYEIAIRHQGGGRYRFLLNGAAKGSWESGGREVKWADQRIPDIEVRTGDEVRIDCEGAEARLDYVQLNRVDKP